MGRFDASPAKIRGGMAQFEWNAPVWRLLMLILTETRVPKARSEKWIRAAGPLDRFLSWKPAARCSFRHAARGCVCFCGWAWGNAGRVHHVHSLGAGDRLAPDRHRRAVGERLVRASLIVKAIHSAIPCAASRPSA